MDVAIFTKKVEIGNNKLVQSHEAIYDKRR